MKPTSATVYLHGKGGSAGEAEHYKPLFPDSDVIGFDYKSAAPWEAKAEFPAFFADVSQKYASVRLIANSIGAFFAMSAPIGKQIEKAYFISPVVDMEKLIADMMGWADVTEEELRERKIIETPFGETLSWEYLSYVRENPLIWDVPTRILYGAGDHLTSLSTITSFAEKIGAELSVMPDGEHWFHTEKQMRFVDTWIKKGEES